MFTVRWKRTALDRLTELWLDAEDRNAINEAVSQIDEALSRNPSGAGESRTDTIRVMFEAPLGVFFEVNHDSQDVYVLRVWVF
jgi:plasmid stabilization system protein ParE